METIDNGIVTARLPAAVLVVAVLTGCATGAGSAPDYAADALESGRGTFGKVALVADPTPPEIETVYFGMTPEARAAIHTGGGALGGAGGGLAVCGQALRVPLLGLLVIPILPVCMGVGAVAGAADSQTDDVPPGYSNEALAEAEASARANLDTGALQARILERAQVYARENVSYQLEPAQSAGSEFRPEWPSYAALSKQGFDTALEVEFIRISLKNSLEMEARARVVSLNDGDVLSSAQYGYASVGLTLEEWMADGAAPLTNAVAQGLESLAEDIVDEAFLLYHPSTQAPPSRWGPVPYYVLAPEYPLVEYSSAPFGDTGASYPNVEPAAVASMPPTFRWERFPRPWDSEGPDGTRRAITKVRYELKVFDVLEDESWPRPGQEVYRAIDLPQAEHRISVELEPCTRYFWTVRARFELDGLTRVTEWAGAYRAALGPEQKPWNLRRGATGPKPSWFYFPFVTPGEDGNCGLLKPEKYLQAREEEVRWILLSALANEPAEIATVTQVAPVKSANVDCDGVLVSDMRPRTVAVFPARGWILGSANEQNWELYRQLMHIGRQALSARDGVSEASYGEYGSGELDRVLDGAIQLTGNTDYKERLHREYAVLFAEKLHVDAVLTYWYLERKLGGVIRQDVKTVLIDAQTGDLYQSSGSPTQANSMTESVLCSYVAHVNRSGAPEFGLAFYSPAQREAAIQRLPTAADKLTAIKILCDDGLLSYEEYDKERMVYSKEGVDVSGDKCSRKPKRTLPVLYGGLKVGILPPAFFKATSPYNDHKEEEIYGEVRRFIRSKSSFTLSVDYAAKHEFGLSEAHTVWQGSAVRKVPDTAKMRDIGKEIGVDILVLAWIKNMQAMTTIDLYVFDVASGKMRSRTARMSQAKELVESTFALANALK